MAGPDYYIACNALAEKYAETVGFTASKRDDGEVLPTTMPIRGLVAPMHVRAPDVMYHSERAIGECNH